MFKKNIYFFIICKQIGKHMWYVKILLNIALKEVSEIIQIYTTR